MNQRIDVRTSGARALKALSGLAQYLASSPLEQRLLDLVCFRVSQVNACAYCLDMHSKDLRAHGETEQRLYALDAWRETPFFSERERAALGWAEAVTDLNHGRVPDEVFIETRKQFSESELVDLTMAVVTINCYNRLNVAFRTTPGTYQPSARAVEAA